MDKETLEAIRKLSHGEAVARLKDLFDEAERLKDKGDRGPLTPEDEARFATLTEEFGATDEHRKGLERAAQTERLRVTREALRTSASDALQRGQTDRGGVPDQRGGQWDYDRDPVSNPDDVERHRFRDPWNLSEVRMFGRDREEVTHELRSRALSAIEKMSGASDKVRAGGTAIVEQFDDEAGSISRLVLATSSPEYLRAWSAAMRGRPLTGEQQAVLARAMSLTDNAGGYLVPFQLDPTVIITSAGSRNDIRMIARQVVATGDVWNGVSSGAATWSWDAEGAQVSDDSTTFAGPAIMNYKGSGFIPISIEALQDEQNVTQEVGRILAFGKDTLEATAFAVGTGSQPQGIVTALVASSPTVIVTSTTADTFAIADVYKIDGALPARHRRAAAWLANRKWYNLVRQFDTAGGAGMWERIGNDAPPELLGRGAYESEDMDGTINAGAENYMSVYGDFSNYVITDRIGFSVEPIPHLFGANGRPTGQRGWYAYYRVGADSVDDGGFVLLNVT